MVDLKNKEFVLVNAKTHLLLETGKRPSEFVTDNPNDIPSLGGENISDDGFLKFDNIRYVSREYSDTVTKGILRDDDILINKDGANTGKMAFVEKPPFQKTLINEHLYIIRNTGEFDQKYLFYCLFDFKGQKQIRAKIVGSAQGGISGGFKKRLMIPKPDLPIQEKISSIISCVDKNIESTKQVILKAERLKKSLMQNFLSGKMKPNGQYFSGGDLVKGELEHAPMKSLQKFRQYHCPKNWKIIPLGEIVDFEYGESLGEDNFRSGNYPVYGSNGIMGYHDSYIVEGPGIVVGRKGTAGAISWTEQNFYPIDTTYYVRINQENVCLRWLYYLLLILELGRLNAATGVPGLNRSDALSLYIPKPPLKEQEVIADSIELVNNTIKTKENKIKILQKLKKSLMQNLLPGKVGVKI